MHLIKASSVSYPMNKIGSIFLIKLFKQNLGGILLKISLILIIEMIMVLYYTAPAFAEKSFYFYTIEKLFLPDFARLEDPNLDLFIDAENRLYILNLKGDQLCISDNHGPSLKKRYDTEDFFSTGNTDFSNHLTKFKLHLPPAITSKKASFWVNGGYIYLKPSEDHLVWVFNLKGELINKIQLKVPENSYLLFTDIVVDQRGYIYLLERNSFQIEVFDLEGNFCGIFTKSGNRENQLPGSPDSIFIDDEGSIYCLVSISGMNKSQIVKYSYQGRKIRTYPDVPEGHYVNIYVDQYQNTFTVNPEESLIEKFDRRGEKICQFQTNCSSGMAVNDQGIVYLVSEKNVILNLMYPATLIQWIDRGNAAFLDESWDLAEKCFLKAKVLDNHVDYIHLALGEIYYQQHQWIKAMNEFKFIKDNWRYSQTQMQFRNDLLINGWPLIATGLLVGSFLISTFIIFIKHYAFSRHISFLRIIWQPEITLKTQTRTMRPLTAVILIMMFAIVHFFSWFLSNPIFTGERQLFSWLVFERSFLITLALIVIWSVTAYKVGELFQGLAKYSDLLNGTAICLIPAIIFDPILTLLSHLLTYGELWIYKCLYGILIGWIIILFFNKIRVTEDFDWSKSLGVGLVNLAATALFLVFLGFIVAINQQIGSFITEVFKEIYNRFTV